METKQEITTRSAMFYHLVFNHYPPYPKAMIDPCIEAVKAALDGNPDKDINLPEGYITQEGKTTMTASEIIEVHNLAGFIEVTA